ncbi:MAG: hypothetical protein F6K54_20675 [Okeania sp. SIO3B5]|uniref:hypothetical protein n=1 Tax=Okeania sp. SIO3B5 TaxID=2607811 RepID=UPI00140155C5|nr:hypothetical protein [Okeania sp. SIO3B5]NEO55271.1 hypothetical protein [Okeania sp. SIO3B5]
MTEERHTKTFTAHPGSKLWLVKLATLENSEKKTQSPNEDNVSEAQTIPPDLAHQLNALNQLQAKYDRALHQLDTLRRQLYEDWYRYMLLAYPSDDEALNYEDIRQSPDVDHIIAYIKELDIKPLQQLMENTGFVNSYDNHSKPIVVSPPTGTKASTPSLSSTDRWHCDWSLQVTGSVQSLANELKGAITQLCTNLNAHNQAQAVPNHKNQWSLNHTVGPRFWSPNEPVVLLSHLTPSDRHGQDDRFTDDKRLICPLVSNIVFPPPDLQASQADNISLVAEIEQAKSDLRKAIDPLLSPHYRQKRSSQAHPFLLEWQANLASVRPTAYRQNPDLPYQPDEIRNNWSLAETDAEVIERENAPKGAERTISFTGNSLLLDYAGGVMDQAVEAYLIESLEDYFTEYKIATADQKQHIRAEIGVVRNWLVRRQSMDELDAIANELSEINSVYSDALYGIPLNGLLNGFIGKGIENFLTDKHPGKSIDEIIEQLRPLLVVSPAANSPDAITELPDSLDNVLPYLLGLSPTQTQEFIKQFQAKAKDPKKKLAADTFLTPQRWAVVLRYAEALGYIASQFIAEGGTEEQVHYRENVLWRPLVMGIPDGGCLASGILSIANCATQTELSQIELSNALIGDILNTRKIKPIESLNQLASLRHFNATQMAHFLYYSQDKNKFKFTVDWGRDKFNGLNEQGHYWVEPRLIAFDAWQTLIKNPGLLTLSLHGFNNALLSKQSTWQLPVADPLGFPAYRAFSERTIKPIVGRQTAAPLPNTPFSPIRGGHLNLQRLRLVDTFGQYEDLDTNVIRTTEQMRSSSVLPISLPPRLVQPARLNVRWLDADPSPNAPDREQQEWNDHPASSPICGWVLPNMLDASLMIYNQDGKALGSLDQTGQWRPKPGSNSIVIPEDIPNPHLQRMVLWLRDKAAADQDWQFIPDFVNTLETAMEYIDPDNFDQPPSLPVLMGRPLALVRVAISLEVQGSYAVQQSLAAFSETLKEVKPTLQKMKEMPGGQQVTLGSDSSISNPAMLKTQEFEQVRFPVRLGEHHRFQDGVVGYWPETARGKLSDRFYAPQSDLLPNEDATSHIRVYRRQDGAMNLWLALKDEPQMVSMLMDVQGSLHVTSGILPTKELIIPTDQVLPALRAIEVTFLTAPLLTARNEVQVNLPQLTGWQWSWVSREAGQWSTLTSMPRIDQAEVFKAFPKEGLTVWNGLLKSRVLTLLPGEPVQALYDAKQLDSALDLLCASSPRQLDPKRKKDVERFLQIQTRSIEPMQSEAKFNPQVLREGWLQLSPADLSSNALFNKADFQAEFGSDGDTLWQDLIKAEALTPFVPQNGKVSPKPSSAPGAVADNAVLNRAKLQEYLAKLVGDTSKKVAIAAFFR